jgi:hypothetical protein
MRPPSLEMARDEFRGDFDAVEAADRREARQAELDVGGIAADAARRVQAREDRRNARQRRERRLVDRAPADGPRAQQSSGRGRGRRQTRNASTGRVSWIRRPVTMRTPASRPRLSVAEQRRAPSLIDARPAASIARVSSASGQAKSRFSPRRR